MTVRQVHGYAGLAHSADEVARRCREVRSAARDGDLDLRVVLIEDRTGRAFGRLIADLTENDLVLIPSRSDLDSGQLARVRHVAAVWTVTEPVCRFERERLSGKRIR